MNGCNIIKHWSNTHANVSWVSFFNLTSSPEKSDFENSIYQSQNFDQTWLYKWFAASLKRNVSKALSTSFFRSVVWKIIHLFMLFVTVSGLKLVEDSQLFNCAYLAAFQIFVPKFL